MPLPFQAPAFFSSEMIGKDTQEDGVPFPLLCAFTTHFLKIEAEFA